MRALSVHETVLLVFVTTVLSLIGLMVLFAFFGDANVVEHSVSGSGTIDDTTMTRHSYDRAMAENASFVMYETKRNWDESTNTFTSSFIVEGVRGGYRNKYEVRSYGAGYKHEYVATKITGSFSGSASSDVIKLGVGTESHDSLIIMDGNATFRGKIVTQDNIGRPVTVADYREIGWMTIRSYLSINQTPAKPDDWLAFCNEVNTTLPKGFGIVYTGSVSG